MNRDDFEKTYAEYFLRQAGRAATRSEMDDSYKACLAVADVANASEWHLVFKENEKGSLVPCVKITKRNMPPSRAPGL